MTGIEERQRAYWNARFRLHWGPAGVSSIPFGRYFNEWRYRVRRRVFRRIVRGLALPTDSLSVLDVGSGTGFYLNEWQALGVTSLAGLDISDRAVAKLVSAYPNVTFYRMSIGETDSPLPVQAFDVASAIDVLTHIVDEAAYQRAIGNIHRSLKQGGWLLYTDSFFHGSGKVCGEYWRGRSLATASAALEAGGVEIVSRVPFSVLFSAPTDSRHRERNEYIWDRALLPVRLSESCGYLYGVLLYPIELLLVSILKESPAIEIMVCRKRP